MHPASTLIVNHRVNPPASSLYVARLPRSVILEIRFACTSMLGRVNPNPVYLSANPRFVSGKHRMFYLFSSKL